MTEKSRITTLPAMKSGINHNGPKAWTPGYAGRTHSHEGERNDNFKNALPTDWTCPCGTALHGLKSCPKCGRVPLGHEQKKLDGYQSMDTGRELKGWKKFIKRGY